MPSILERCQTIWDYIRQGQTQLPSTVAIPHDHVATEERLGVLFQSDEHYFQVRLNEMYLTHDRQWFSIYAPMVFIVSEFIYDKREEAVPFVVGPTIMEKFGQEIPANMVFSDTRVAGLHPYRGGRLSLSVVLYQVQRANYARNLLRVVENITNVLNVSLPLRNYLKVASVALDGFETIMQLGGTVPLIASRKEFDPDGGDQFASGYFALIDLPQTQLNPNMLWIRSHQLFSGQSLEQAQPFRRANFVLYSIIQSPERGDLRTLPFYPLYQQIKKGAIEPYADVWQRTKVNMTALAQTMLLSPDLTNVHADRLNDQYTTEMEHIHKKAVDRGMVGPAKRQSALDVKLSKTLNILDL